MTAHDPVENIPFDTTEHPVTLERAHAFSLTSEIPGTQLFSAAGDSLHTEGPWARSGYRETARRFLAAREPGGRIRLRCTGRALSLLRPTDFPLPEPRTYGPPMTGALASRVDGGQWRPVSCEAGREVLLASGLSPGAHEVEIRCAGRPPDFWAVEGVRAWPERPAVVTGRIDGGPMLVDLRAEITGPVAFTRSLRDGRTGRFSLLLPRPGRYEMALTAPGWEPASVPFDAPAGAGIELPPISLRPPTSADTQSRPLSPDEPLVLVANAHCNTWGTEPAEWLARRAGWINAQRPHALLAANEVNPAYVAGALRDVSCPWVITDGNHRQAGFGDWQGDAHRDLRIGPARILTAGIGTGDEEWREVLARFRPDDKLRIVCAYEPFAPPELLEAAGVRLYFYGHNLEYPPYWTRGGTTFLRKVDSDTFYRIEIGPPHDSTAPVKISRFVFSRAE